MRHTLAIAARELRERWILFPASFAIGCIPLALPAFGAHRDDALLMGVASAFLLGATAAVVIGASMLARDAALGRLGFLFSRPVSWRAIWGGKWLAALVLVFGSGLLAAIPWMAFYPPPNAHGASWLAPWDAQGAVMRLAVAVLVVGLANFNATAFRSRSPWLVIDLLLLVAAVWAVREYVAPLGRYGLLISAWAPQAACGGLGLALLVGSAAQVAYGRTDLRRAHRALSLGAWALVWVALATAAGVVFWVRAARPADLNAFAVTRAPAGGWAYVVGPARMRGGFYFGAYLIDTTSGRFLRAPDEGGCLGSATGMLFSGDGRLAACPAPDPNERGTALTVFDLTASAPVATTVALERSPPLEPWRSALALSPNGRLVFYVHGSGASLYELPSGHRIATTTLQPGFRAAATRFISDGGARAWLVPADEAGPRSEMRIVDLAADGRAATQTFATFRRLTGSGPVVANASGSRIVTLDDGLRLRDGADGRLIATLAEGNGTDAPRAAMMLAAQFLADGRLVTADGTAGAQPRIAVFDSAGSRLGETLVPMPQVGLVVGPELAPGRVVLSSSRGPWPYEVGESVVFDANAGRVAQSLSGLRPAVGFFLTPAVPAAAPLSPAQLFRDAEGRLLRVDTATGERKIVAGPGAPAGERLRWR